MWTAKEIWEAGKTALAGVAAKLPNAPAPDQASEEAEPEDFEMTALDALQLEDRPYRVHFRGGTSGEYDGAQLRVMAPFDLSEVVSIDPV
jgi:hypothetical protein